MPYVGYLAERPPAHRLDRRADFFNVAVAAS